MPVYKVVRAAAALLAAVLLAGCFNIRLGSGVASRGRPMVLETLVPAKSRWTTDRVLLVSIDGILRAGPGDGGLFSEASTLVHLKDVLSQAEKDPSIRALLLRIDSPGGSVTASDLIHRELTRFKEKTDKKIVAVGMGVMASGGYYAAMAADSVHLHPTTVTGSIGVIGLFPNLAGLSNKIGLDMRVIKSGAHKDMGSMWRSFTDQEREILQQTINAMQERFLGVVERGRPNLDAEAIRRLADGRIYNAEQAVESGLADAVGYIDDAFEKSKALAEVSDAALVVYKRPRQYRGHYYAAAGQVPAPSPAPLKTEINLLKLDAGNVRQLLGGGPFYYLWLP